MARWATAGQEEGRLGLPQPCPEFRFPKDSNLGLPSRWWQLYQEAKRHSTQRHALQRCQLRISGRCNQSCKEPPPQCIPKQLEREIIICLICQSHDLWSLWSPQASRSNITQKKKLNLNTSEAVEHSSIHLALHFCLPSTPRCVRGDMSHTVPHTLTSQCCKSHLFRRAIQKIFLTN